MPDAIITCDLGSLLNKGFFSVKPFKPELLIMESEVAKATQESLEEYEEVIKLGSLAPENAAWVEYRGQYRAVGFSAKDYFNADLNLQAPKVQLALYKTLAIIGAIAQKKGLPNGASISLGVLFPYGEYRDRQLFQEMITDAIGGFRFRGEERSFELARLVCRPEGFGLISRGRPSGSSLKEQVIVVVVVGYRDASIYVWERGTISKGATKQLGFNKLIQTVKLAAPSQESSKLAAAICKAGAKVSIKALAHLSRFNDPCDTALKDKEIAQLRKTISIARAQYWLELSSWLRERIPSHVDEAIVTGGTAYYYEREFNELFSSVRVNWGSELEEQINRCFQAKVAENGLSYRLTDNYGFFYYQCGTEESTERTTTHVRAS
ncbi:MAG: hypothetical protein CLLPBCKN_006905 [Chroococcidiopsis cubana SAG 39.79]|jgi:hypothetical protein|uniref:Actin-like protein N-terminal domain-containing protein n=1 Tax=Chroococcidiopsis cubana SAG 39.79 TaxID=388085 RepID=A0AB37U963_9CYAN|nr:ParM/StbA family protein [Chroococcidiopsis cubana]MDZ4877470.1 hypothetical protein [Chroococcidiopsis cubana SAG 39.79]PSB58914.1 hypothetical protein C7B79_29375 [Chroococcidiopsis cubana CCALA 043]RUT01183.1 hypothetical protein DSM107010_65940 [Chroococcidiopsis cubana SAG 39.79]